MKESNCRECKYTDNLSSQDPCNKCLENSHFVPRYVNIPSGLDPVSCADCSNKYDHNAPICKTCTTYPICPTDTHYRKIEADGIEPITLMEHINAREGIPANARLCIALAQKHVMRAGVKDGENWTREIAKAKNYLNRALTGAWE